MAGIGQQLKLSEEARDARNAGRRLEDETDETDLIGTVKKLEDLIAEQRQSNERIAREMRGMVSEMKDVLEKVEELRNGAEDAQHQANQMALMGVANAQQKAGEMTIIYRFMEHWAPFTDCSVFMLAIKLEVGYTIP